MILFQLPIRLNVSKAEAILGRASNKRRRKIDAKSELIEVAFRFRQVSLLPAMSFQLALVHKGLDTKSNVKPGRPRSR